MPPAPGTGHMPSQPAGICNPIIITPAPVSLVQLGTALHTAMASGPRTPRFTAPSPWTRPKDANSGRARKHLQIMTTMANPQGCYLDETCSGLGTGARRPPTRPGRQKPRPGSPPSPSSSKPSPSRAPQPRRDDASAGGEGLPQLHRCSKSLPEMRMGSNSPEQLNLHTSP